MKKGKKGQFYLIAGIVITVIILGLISVNISLRREPTFRFYGLEDEIKIEVNHFMRYAENLVILDPSEDWIEHARNFTDDYQNYFSGQKSHYFIFGNYPGNLVIKGFQEESNNNNITFNESPPIQVTINQDRTFDYEGNWPELIPGGTEGEGGIFSLNVGNNSYSFKIKGGKNFCFIISKIEGIEEYSLSWPPITD
ncbi:hypothetical protein K0A97_03380 [Patescibacteria group bacterium]|nr:hypothetical protein [Patescibacteria group bacterium]